MPRDLARAPLLLFAVAVAVIAADQATKIWAMAALAPGQTTPVIHGVLHWTLQRNPGAAFGLFQRFPVVFTILASAISAFIIWTARTVTTRGQAVALGLVLGGAVGNLIDRLVRDPGFLRGHVVDFIDLRVWPVFNIADSAVVTGALLLIVVSRSPRRDDAGADAGDAGAHADGA